MLTKKDKSKSDVEFELIEAETLFENLNESQGVKS